MPVRVPTNPADEHVFMMAFWKMYDMMQEEVIYEKNSDQTSFSCSL